MKLNEIFKSKKNAAISLVIFIVLFGCLWSFVSASLITRNFKEKISNQTYKNREANIDSLLVTETQDSKKLWELYAERGAYTDADNIVFLEDILGNFYDENGVKASIKADRGSYNNITKHIVLYDNIVMVYRDGTCIKADKTEYKGKDEDVIAEGNVEITKPGEVVIKSNRAVLDGTHSHFYAQGRTETKFYL